MNSRIKILSLVLGLFLGSSCSSPETRQLVLVTGADPEHAYLKKQVAFLSAVFESVGYELRVEKHQSQKCFELSNGGLVDGEMWRIKGVDRQYQNLVRVPAAIWAHPELAFVKETSNWKIGRRWLPTAWLFEGGRKSLRTISVESFRDPIQSTL